MVTHRDLRSLGERFGTVGLEKSLVNVSAESTYLSVAAESQLKRLTDGDPITVEYKGKDPFSAYCAPKIIVVTNEAPRFSDDTGALDQRSIILPFAQQIDMSQAQEHLASAIFLAEGPAILNWAIDGLKRLLGGHGMRRDRFSLSQASIEAAAEHRRSSNPVVDWFESFVEIDPDFAIGRQDAYNNFVFYMATHGFPTNHPHRIANNFFKALRCELRRQGVIVGPNERLLIGSDREYVFRGIRLTGNHATGNLRIKSPNLTASAP